MNFQDCLTECCKHTELIKQFDRLQGTHLMRVFHDTRPPIVKMIDESTGYQKELDKQAHEDMQKFIGFVFECIWMPLVSEV